MKNKTIDVDSLLEMVMEEELEKSIAQDLENKNDKKKDAVKSHWNCKNRLKKLTA